MDTINNSGFVTKLLVPAWQAVNMYTMVYWLVWMTAVVITGTAVGLSLSFGIPLILPAIYLAWKAFSKKEDKQKAEEDEAKQLMMQYYALQQLAKEIKARFPIPTNEKSEKIKVDLGAINNAYAALTDQDKKLRGLYIDPAPLDSTAWNFRRRITTQQTSTSLN